MPGWTGTPGPGTACLIALPQLVQKVALADTVLPQEGHCMSHHYLPDRAISGFTSFGAEFVHGMVNRKLPQRPGARALR